LKRSENIVAAHASLCTTSKLQFSLFTNMPNYHGSLVGTRDEQEVARMASHVRVIGANNCRTNFAAQNERSHLACVVCERSHVSSRSLLTYFPASGSRFAGLLVNSLIKPTHPSAVCKGEMSSATVHKEFVHVFVLSASAEIAFRLAN
jgi:hypothetical protein